MNYSSGSRKPSRMIASREDPWISVSLLAEHVYCPRAGVIQYETAQEDTGEEQDRFHLGRGRRTFYDFNQLLRELKRTQKNLFRTIVVLVITVLLLGGDILVSRLFPNTIIASIFILMLTSLISGIAFLVLLFFCLRWLDIYFVHYLPAKSARASIPDPHHTESQLVKWWSLINAGFQPIRPEEQYRDVQWHLVGCPWRVLVKGDLRIPVFRKRLNTGTAGEKLFRQHYARMAAYCHLLEKCENAQSPYGIVLFGDSYQGMTVPCQPSSKKAFHDGLVGARATVANIQRFLPMFPTNAQTCIRCPHSWRDRTTGESVCGARFFWTPPNLRDSYR